MNGFIFFTRKEWTNWLRLCRRGCEWREVIVEGLTGSKVCMTLAHSLLNGLSHIEKWKVRQNGLRIASTFGNLQLAVSERRAMTLVEH